MSSPSSPRLSEGASAAPRSGAEQSGDVKRIKQLFSRLFGLAAMALVSHACGGEATMDKATAQDTVQQSAAVSDGQKESGVEKQDSRSFYPAFSNQGVEITSYNPEPFVLKAFGDKNRAGEPIFVVEIPAGSHELTNQILDEETMTSLPGLVYWKAEKAEGAPLNIVGDPSKVNEDSIYGSSQTPTPNLEKEYQASAE